MLSIPRFVDPSAIQPAIDFQRVVNEFLSKCHESGKKKLIIDMRGNSAGLPYLAYDTFKQLFPQLRPYSGTRIRASDAPNVLV